MRIMGSYKKTAWTWLHKLRAARPEREPLGPFVQMDEALVGGKGGPHKELVLVAAEAGGRVRLAHAETNDKATLKRFADGAYRSATDHLAPEALALGHACGRGGAKAAVGLSRRVSPSATTPAEDQRRRLDRGARHRRLVARQPRPCDH